MGRMEQNGHDASPRIAGRYRLLEKLGTGGMSVVWRGHDDTLGRPVAVKVLSPRLANDQTFRDRLRQEALAAARLCHPHITGIYDFGESPLYVVMELNDGESVATRLTRRGPLPWRAAVTMAAEVASALATAHSHGLVHRDVTPANVMLTGAGAKVVDFGISAIVGQCDAAPDGSLLGTPAYLAPERLAGAQVATATDVYALGLLLYRALTGRLPWPAETTAEALRAHLYAAPEPLPALPGLPTAIADLCLTCLAKNPADRPDAATAARSLAAAVGVQPILPSARTHPADAPPTIRAAAAPIRPRPARGLSLPSGHVAGFVRAVRLRAGLRIGRALQLGDVHPLGGGLFAGGGVTRDLLTGRTLLRGRHRLQAALVTVALLSTATIGWVATRETPNVEQAQAAGTDPPGGSPVDSTACSVRYQVKHDTGSDYEAVLTVTTTEEAGRVTWRVVFAYPGSQRVTSAPATVTQKGRRVTAKGRGTLRAFTLRGAYRGYNPLPLAFTLNGRKCRAEVVGATIDIRDTTPDGDSPAPSRKHHKRRHPPNKSGTPQKRVDRDHPSAAHPPPDTQKASGFTLAL